MTRWLGAVIQLVNGRLTGGLFVAALLSACATVEPPSPAPGPTARLPPIAESSLNLRASVDYAAMSAAADKAVPPVILNLAAVDLGHDVTFRLTGSRSDIQVSQAGGQIGFRTNAHVDGAIDSPCLLARCRGTLQVDGQVWGTARPTINPNWTVNLSPTGQFLINEADVRIPLFPKAVSIKDPLSKVLQGPFDDLVDHINDEVSKSLKLKAAAETAWSELGRPIAVSASPSIWLSVNPTRVLTEQPTITGQGVELGVALVARPELVIGDKPPDRDIGALPNLTLVDKAPDQFSIYLPVRMSWVDANELAELNLVGRQLQAGGGVTVFIDHIAVFNNGDEIGVRIVFHAKSSDGGWKPSGTLFFLGTPVYNLNEGYIAVEHLHFDVKTQDTILRLAAWLSHQSLIDDLQSHLRFDVRDQVKARRQDLDRAINNTQLDPRVSLQGEILSIAPSAVYLTRDALQVNIVALGTLKVIVH